MACIADEWKEMALTVVTKLINSMPARCAALPLNIKASDVIKLILSG
jgi:hypothetical protein